MTTPTTGIDFGRRVCQIVSTYCLLVLLTPPVVAGQTAAIGERLTLDNALNLAVANNRRLQSARLDVDRAEANLSAQRTRRLPVFEADVTASQLLAPVDFAFPQGAFGTFPGTGPIPAADTKVSAGRKPAYFVQSQLSQPISQLFKIGLGIQSAATSREIERERARSEQLSVINNVRRVYFLILQSESALAATNAAITMYRELDRTLQVRLAQQATLRADSLDVQVHLAQEELSRTIRLNTIASQKEQLNQLLGRDVRTTFDVEDVPPLSIFEVDVAAAQTRALERRPDVREARLKLQQADLDRRMTKADRIPEVSVAVSYVSNINIDILPANFATVGVRATWEPFDWGRRRYALAAKTRTVEQARLGVREVEDRAVLEVNARFRTLAEKRALVNVSRMAQAATREKLRVKTNQFQLQAVLLPDVMQIRAELANMDDHYQRALLEFWTAKADYEHAVGEELLQ